MAETLETRITRGLEYLNLTYGAKALKKVKADEIDMTSVFTDVEALVAGKPNLMSYDPMHLSDMLDRGFMPAASETWEQINEAWKARLN